MPPNSPAHSLADPRALVDRLVRAALDAVEPGQLVRNAMRPAKHALLIGGDVYPRAQFRRLVVVGAGKASGAMAWAAEEIAEQAGWPVVGHVVAPYGHAAPTRLVRLHEASHPLPDQAGIQATRELLALLDTTDERDLVLCLISGGGSALLVAPAPPLDLDDLQRTTDLLLRSGAPIQDVNVLRKHLDLVKGGGLARRAAPAPIVTLVLSDVIGDSLDAIASGPTVPDPSTWQDARRVASRWSIWDQLPARARQRIQSGMDGSEPDTPKSGDPGQMRRPIVVGNNRVAAEAARAEAQQLGYNAVCMLDPLLGEARQAGTYLAGLVQSIHDSERPCCLVLGGETTVTVRGSGRGGRNQECALAAAIEIQGLPRVLLACLATDGRDGPTDAAGAVVDGTTCGRARALGLDPARSLAENDAYTVFSALGDLIHTGPTYTNVNDLAFLLAW